jgi:hypothetical protein
LGDAQPEKKQRYDDRSNVDLSGQVILDLDDCCAGLFNFRLALFTWLCNRAMSPFSLQEIF